MRRSAWFVLIAVALPFVAACSSEVGESERAYDTATSEPTGSGGGTSTSDPGSSASTGGTTGDSDAGLGLAGASSGDSAAPGSSNNNGSGVAEPGTLTAGVWDDNRNFERFLGYRASLFEQQLAGLLTLTEAEHQSAFDALVGVPPARQTLDVSLVVDTTGSMGDELNYLQAEFIALSSTIQERHPNAAQRWSLILYRDVGDEYVVRSFDFSSDLDTFRKNLAAQSAGGGGDFPEAPDQAFAAMNQQGWRTGSSAARVAFWVADAPHHAENAAAFSKEIRTAQQQGISVYPIASSGIDELTELTMRSAAQLTGGRYIFLTNDSGVGGDHKEPTIPCYFVTKLDKAILRMIDIEMSGVYAEPDAADILRTGGNPQDGACALESGDTVYAY
jgi:hypothetical protein